MRNSRSLLERALALVGDRRPRSVLTSDAQGNPYWARLGDGVELANGEVTATPASPPPSSGASFNTFVSSGGQVIWESGFTFRVSAAVYYINATRYASVEQTITLDAADPSDPRLDVIALDTTGAVVKLTGTPAAAASEPTVDPASYVKLALVSVPAGATSPAGATNVTVYAEAAGGPGEWNWTASAGSIVVSSTTNPHTGTKTIEGTNVGAGVYARGTISAGSIEPNDYQHLVFFLRSKAAWNASRGLLISFRSAGVLLGAAVQIRRTGTYGFDSTVTTAYQQIAIPVSAFAIPAGTTATQVQVEDFGGAIGFYLDNVSLQVGASTPAPAGITEAQADARYAPLIHAPRHQSGGADPLSVTTLAGFPGGTTDFLRADGTFATPPGGGSGLDELTGDVTAGPGSGSQAATIAADAVSNTKLANMAQATLKGRASGAGTGDPQDLSSAQAYVFLAPNFAEPIIAHFDGGGVAIAAGLETVAIRVPYAMTITGAYAFSDVSGSIAVDIWKSTYAGGPPTNSDSITASAPVSLSSAVKSEDVTLTGWTTAVAAGDLLIFHVDSATTVTKVTIELVGTRA